MMKMKKSLWSLLFVSCLSYADEAVQYEAIYQSAVNWYVHLEKPYPEESLKDIAIEICPKLMYTKSGRCVVHYWTDPSSVPKNREDRLKKIKSGRDVNKYAHLFATRKKQVEKKFYITLCADNKNGNSCRNY